MSSKNSQELLKKIDIAFVWLKQLNMSLINNALSKEFKSTDESYQKKVNDLSTEIVEVLHLLDWSKDNLDLEKAHVIYDMWVKNDTYGKFTIEVQNVLE